MNEFMDYIIYYLQNLCLTTICLHQTEKFRDKPTSHHEDSKGDGWNEVSLTLIHSKYRHKVCWIVIEDEQVT